MITLIIPERFTARQMYQFTQMIRKTLSPEQRLSPANMRAYGEPQTHSRQHWDRDFIRIWSSHRKPSFALLERFIIWIYYSYPRLGDYYLQIMRFSRLWLQYGRRYPDFYYTEYEAWVKKKKVKRRSMCYVAHFILIWTYYSIPYYLRVAKVVTRIWIPMNKLSLRYSHH